MRRHCGLSGDAFFDAVRPRFPGKENSREPPDEMIVMIGSKSTLQALAQLWVLRGFRVIEILRKRSRVIETQLAERLEGPRKVPGSVTTLNGL